MQHTLASTGAYTTALWPVVWQKPIGQRPSGTRAVTASLLQVVMMTLPGNAVCILEPHTYTNLLVGILQVPRSEMQAALALRFGGDGIVKMKGLPFKATADDVIK